MQYEYTAPPYTLLHFGSGRACNRDCVVETFRTQRNRLPVITAPKSEKTLCRSNFFGIL